MNPLANFTADQLLAELISRNEQKDPPTTRHFGTGIKEIAVGIGEDNYADISFPEEALVDLGLKDAG